MENFAVKSESFALYEAFKKDVEKIGWVYNEAFTPFTKEDVTETNCLFFANDWDGKPLACSFSLSNSDDTKSFHLETQYGEALAFAKKVWEKENKVSSIMTPMSQDIACRLSASFTKLREDITSNYYSTDICGLSINCPFNGTWVVENPILKPVPKFKVGEWVGANNGNIFKIDQICGVSYVRNKSENNEYEEWYSEESLKKWLPKKGEYYHCNLLGGSKWMFISNGKGEFLTSHFATINLKSMFYDDNCNICGDDDVLSIRPATPSEIALLDSKLSEQGKRFDKEKLEFVDIPKHKEPIIGEMVIGWENHKYEAIIGVLKEIYYPQPNFCIYNVCNKWLNNAILFESPEQYKAFLKS